MIRPAIGLLVVAALSACNVRMAGQRGPEWERGGIDATPLQREVEVSLPAYPQERDLIEFFAGPLRSHKYYLDASTLSVGADGIVRYASVIKTTGGATNVAYEGIRCANLEKRVYALGSPAGRWIEAKRSEWMPIRTADYQVTLYKDFFCPDRRPVADRETALRALRGGLRGADARGSDN